MFPGFPLLREYIGSVGRIVWKPVLGHNGVKKDIIIIVIVLLFVAYKLLHFARIKAGKPGNETRLYVCYAWSRVNKSNSNTVLITMIYLGMAVHVFKYHSC